MPELKKLKMYSLLKTEYMLLKTKDGPSVNRKLLTHILTNIPTHPLTSKLDDYNKISLQLSLKKESNEVDSNKETTMGHPASEQF